MPISQNDGFHINAPRYADMRSGKMLNNASIPFASDDEALASIPAPYRAHGSMVFVAGVWKMWNEAKTGLVVIAPKPYISYVGLISQSGTNAPTLVSFQNELVGVTTSYFSVGVYFIESQSFGAGKKVIVFVGNDTTGVQGIQANYKIVDNRIVVMAIEYGTVPNWVNGRLINVPIEIRIYG